MAQDDSARKALDQRYQVALEEAVARGTEGVFKAFDAAAQTSKAVIARPLRDIDRLTSSDRELFATFYALTGADVRLPYGDKWDRLRRLADEALFPGYKEHIRFAALTLGAAGLAEFGDAFLVLKEEMIAHRASVFEENSASFLECHNYEEPDGSRAVWGERSKLCTAKNAKKLTPEMSNLDFPGVLLQQKTDGVESRFVEVHIYGPMSIRSVEKIVLKKDTKRAKKSFRLELRDRLVKVDAYLEEE